MQSEAERKRAEYIAKLKASNATSTSSSSIPIRKEVVSSNQTRESPKDAKAKTKDELQKEFIARHQAKLQNIERFQLKTTAKSAASPKKSEAKPVIEAVVPPVPIESKAVEEEDSFDNLPSLQRSFSLTYDSAVADAPAAPVDVVAKIDELVTEPPAEKEKVISKKINKRKLIETLDEDEVAVALDPNTIFSQSNLLFEGVWNSRSTPVDQVFVLREFNCPLQYQTLALQLTIPNNSVGWSLNITPAEDLALSDIYFHFNPRYKKGFIMQNDRQGTWGAPVKSQIDDGNYLRSLSIKSSKMELVVQIRREGFAVFINKVFVVFFMHRRDLFSHSDSHSIGHKLSTAHSSNSNNSSSESGAIDKLKLIIPARDGNGNADEVIVHKVWWGHTDHSLLCMPAEMESRIKMNFANATAEASKRTADIAMRTVAVTGLPVSDNLVELESIEFALFDLFADFTPETISVPPGKGIAFARLTNKDNVQAAIDALNGSIIGAADDNGEGQSVLCLAKL